MRILVAVIFVAGVIVSNHAHGDLVSFSLELNSGGSPKVTIDNRSAARWIIESVSIDFTAANVVLDTTLADGIGTDGVDEPLAFIAPGTFGSYSTAVTAAGLAAYSNTGNLAGLAGDINTTGVPGRQMTFAFGNGGISTGNGWGFNVDWDEFGSNDSPRGGDINGTTVTVTFHDVNNPARKFVLPFTYSGFGGNGVSFPGLISANAVPEPATAMILLLALAMVSSRFRDVPGDKLQ